MKKVVKAGSYRKRPVVVKAVRYDGSKESIQAVIDLVGNDDRHMGVSLGNLIIETEESFVLAQKGDYVAMGTDGKLYSCPPDAFEATYETVTVEDAG